MTGFRHDSFSRSRAGAAPPSPEAPRARGSLSLIVSIALALMLLALSRVEHHWLTGAREELTAALEPALALARLPVEGARAIADAPIGESELLKQIAELKQENTELRQWRLRAQDLEGQVSELRRIVAGVPDRQVGIATGRIFVEGDPTFAASAIIDIGATHGVKAGFAAINGDGLVGTIVAAGPRSARLLLLTDRRSRIPVFVGKERLRGILSGNGAGAPSLELVAAATKIESGALISTSGEDGMLPRGVPIGHVVAKEGTRGVQLNAALDRLDFVSVLLFEPPGADFAQGTLGLGQ